MDLFTPLRVGAQVATGAAHVASDAAKFATHVPMALLEAVLRHRDGAGDEPRYAPTRPAGGVGPEPVAEPSGPAPGGTGRRTPSPAATRGRAATASPDVEVTKGPPEPTSAAGASGGVAGTADAPGDAARAGAPDPTAATSTRGRPVAPRGARTQRDITPAAPISAAKTVDDTPTLVETEGSGAPSANLRVGEPWPNYTKMKAPDIVDRVQGADASVKAVVRLYEQTHKKRKSILTATG
jgi:hypothetical protein